MNIKTVDKTIKLWVKKILIIPIYSIKYIYMFVLKILIENTHSFWYFITANYRIILQRSTISNYRGIYSKTSTSSYLIRKLYNLNSINRLILINKGAITTYFYYNVAIN